jgi:hypothetical protein
VQVLERAADGTLVVRFDSGGVHRYGTASHHKLRRMAAAAESASPAVQPRRLGIA